MVKTTVIGRKLIPGEYTAVEEALTQQLGPQSPKELGRKGVLPIVSLRYTQWSCDRAIRGFSRHLAIQRIAKSPVAMNQVAIRQIVQEIATGPSTAYWRKVKDEAGREGENT